MKDTKIVVKVKSLKVKSNFKIVVRTIQFELAYFIKYSFLPKKKILSFNSVHISQCFKKIGINIQDLDFKDELNIPTSI